MLALLHKIKKNTISAVEFVQSDNMKLDLNLLFKLKKKLH